MTITMIQERVLHTFVPNKSFGHLLVISTKNLIFLKTNNSQFSYIEVWFTYQNSDLSVKYNLKRSDKYVVLSNLSTYYT